MIEKILERLEEESNFFGGEPMGTLQKQFYCEGVKKAIEIVKEVATEYGYCRKLNRCDTCNHYVADEVPPICYFCCKGMEDNYQQKGE